MRCPECQTENPDDTRFCGNCAAPLSPSEENSVLHTKTLQMPPKDIIKGTVFAERYKVNEELGRGGMGIVYRAEDTKLKRSVALKFLPPELIQDEEAKGRFVLEAQAAAALSHPNICTIHEIDDEADRSFISMEYVEGKSLKEKRIKAIWVLSLGDDAGPRAHLPAPRRCSCCGPRVRSPPTEIPSCSRSEQVRQTRPGGNSDG